MRYVFIVLLGLPFTLYAQYDPDTKGRKFEQMGTLLPTPNIYRTASGDPGPGYWQQKADYDISVTLDDQEQSIAGQETITYHNNAPIPLNYLWIQLEQNVRSENSDTYTTHTARMDGLSTKEARFVKGGDPELGFRILEVKDSTGTPLPHRIVKTMMRIDMPEPLQPGHTFSLSIKWFYNINNRSTIGGRSGFEYFPEDGNYLYTIAQFFPRMAVYNDVEGWQNKQFLGAGEFALPFGDYKVRITTPDDHVVMATGTLQNSEEVLTTEQRERLETARNSAYPVDIITQEEAEKNEKSAPSGQKTWIYEAKNVRDFAWTSSRKFIWDAMGVDIDGRTVMAMSLYPKEAQPLYGQYSTKVVAYALKVYSKYTFPYPYPKAVSVEANNGMEYPMMAFNYGRPGKNGQYSDYLKRGMISVIIHEVGHNFFPMIVNSDERQWTWVDEGLNSFVQYLAEQEWEPDYPSRRGPAKKIIPYMKGADSYMVPVMTNSEQVKQFGNNAYGKPATALNILREVVLGPELFDFAFKQFAQKWAFKHPTPADFFRSIEDASAIDLDWFWKGWFYTTDHVDIGIEDVTWYKYDPDVSEEAHRRGLGEGKTPQENALKQPVTMNPVLGKITGLSDPDKNYYELHFKNHGGLVMPVLLQIEFKDGTIEDRQFPAEIWRKNEDEVYKILILEKEVAAFTIDPKEKTADVDVHNNNYPRQAESSRFKKYKESQSNPGGG